MIFGEFASFSTEILIHSNEDVPGWKAWDENYKK